MMSKQIALPMSNDEERDPPHRGPPAEHTAVPYDSVPAAPISLSSESMPLSPIDTPLHRSTALVRDFDVSLLALSKVRGVGLKTLRALYEHFTDLSRVWQMDHESLANLLQQLRVKDACIVAATMLDDQEALRTEAERTLNRFRAGSISLIARHDPAFPSRLAERSDSPHWIFVEGSVTALQTPLIGIVGTRRPSPIGIQTTERLTAILCREGFGIVSGLAEGIDATAHRVGLYYQAPQVGVLGTGIDIVFPASTEGIRRRIVETGGAVITEYMPGDNYSRANFVQRNRIQAALSQALCPVESQEQSGTTHTLRFAEQYGRPIFGVVRGKPAPQNAMVNLIASAFYPVFDLEQRDRIQALIEWLGGVVAPETWPRERRKVNVRWFFQDLLRLVDDIVDDIPVRPEDLAWFQEQVAHRSGTDGVSPHQKGRG
jgi:DNA processing protein